MDADGTQLFDPESNALNPRAAVGEGDDACPRCGATDASQPAQGCWHEWHGEWPGPSSWDHLDAPPSDGAREHARSTDPSTSKRAARGRDKNRTVGRDTQKHTILAAFKDLGPMTSDEACEQTRMIRAWRRVSDLTKGGFIRETGDERPSRQGRPQRVLAITARGEAALTFLASGEGRYYRA